LTKFLKIIASGCRTLGASEGFVIELSSITQPVGAAFGCLRRCRGFDPQISYARASQDWDSIRRPWSITLGADTLSIF